MYNRYSPGPGGMYRRIPQQERPAPPPKPAQPMPPPPPSPPKPEAKPEARPQPPYGGSQLRLPLLDRLLPGADDGDLLLLLILLLLLSDGNEDSQSVALTLAIFLCLQ